MEEVGKFFEAEDGDEELFDEDIELPTDGENDAILTEYAKDLKPRQVDIDMVFVVDCTDGMEKYLPEIKNTIWRAIDEVQEMYPERRNRAVRQLRTKLIGFRDYYYDSKNQKYPPMSISRFFDLPREMPEFEKVVTSLKACGGGDEPESALEALHFAFRSDWNKEWGRYVKKRQLIMLFTDASAHWLNDPRRYAGSIHNGQYPKEGMPKTLDELGKEYHDPELFPGNWGGMVYSSRLLIFASLHKYPWQEIDCWNHSYVEDIKCMEDSWGAGDALDFLWFED